MIRFAAPKFFRFEKLKWPSCRALSFTWGALLAPLLACSHFDKREAYRDLSTEEKAIFLNYYTDLNESQRRDLLKRPERSKELLEGWGIAEKVPLEFNRARILGALQIQPAARGAITNGNRLALKAILDFRSPSLGGAVQSKSQNVSDEVIWKVSPPIARIEDGALRYECLQSDLTISADFLEEAHAEWRMRISKPMKALKIRVDESSQGIESDDHIKLQVWAECTDGTATDVSCQATWSTDPETGRFAGCGQIQVLSTEGLSEGWAVVQAQYGGLTQTQKIYFPPKSKISR